MLEREKNRPTVRRHAEILQGRGLRGVLSLPELTTILERERVLGMPICQSLSIKSSTKSIFLRIKKIYALVSRKNYLIILLVILTEVACLDK